MVRTSIFVVLLLSFGAFAGVAAAEDGPMADAGLDQTVTVDTQVQLDGTGSGHPDGPIAGYEWTIRTPDGREMTPDCADCERSRFTPSLPGRYDVTLTVTGPNGTEATDTLYVYVEDAGPNVELTGDRTPDPNEPVTYTATAESPDAELEEVAWAIEDEIVTVRSLDGTSAQDELSLAFTDPETHRVQVVVRDTNGRTAYAQLLVQPQTGDTEMTSSWSDVEPSSPDCSDGDYMSANPDECLDIETPESTPSETQGSTDFEPFEVLYATDGYQSRPLAGMNYKDSSYVGSTMEVVGLDGGENAPWRQSLREKTVDTVIEEGSKFLFGQERKTVTCEISGGNTLQTGCEQKVNSLEHRGRTSNTYSPTETGAYSEYGLTGGERVRGNDPTNLKEGQKAEITIIIQQEDGGIVDQTVALADSSTDRVSDVAADVIGSTGENDDTSSNNEARNSRKDASRGDDYSGSRMLNRNLGSTTPVGGGLLSGNESPDSTSNTLDTDDSSDYESGVGEEGLVA